MAQKQLAEEYPPVGESALIDDLAQRLKAKIIEDNTVGIMRRDAHPKMHGVVRAEFTVEPDLPAALRVGIFSEPKTFQAWIRFSNAQGTIQPDSKKDIRGMAIKLMDVTGKKILEQEQDETTQDFLLISNSVFITRDVAEFDGLTKALTGNLFAKLGFFLTHFGVLWKTLAAMKEFSNPLQIRYWSTTPYLFGSSAVKYSAIPHVTSADPIPTDADDNFLRTAMVRQLDGGAAAFDFMVQLQSDAEAMPIENAMQEWFETLSPFRKVATIRILQQNFDTGKQREFGENLSFTPWHSLPEHRPLGGINRARKVVYNVISQFRHQQNNVPRQEPNSWEI